MRKRYCVRCGCPLTIVLGDDPSRTNCVSCGPDMRDAIPKREIHTRMFASEIVQDRTRPDNEVRRSSALNKRHGRRRSK